MTSLPNHPGRMVKLTINRLYNDGTKFKNSMPDYSKEHLQKCSYGGGGTVLAQLIGVILYPITQDCIPRRVWCFIAIFSSSYMTHAASLKYEWSIPIAESNDEVINIVALSLLILILIASLLNFLRVVPTKGFVIKIIGQELFPYRLLLPVGVFLTGLYEIILQIGYRERVYKTITKTKLTQVITGESVKIGLGFLGIGST